MTRFTYIAEKCSALKHQEVPARPSGKKLGIKVHLWGEKTVDGKWISMSITA